MPRAQAPDSNLALLVTLGRSKGFGRTDDDVDFLLHQSLAALGEDRGEWKSGQANYLLALVSALSLFVSARVV